MSQRGCFDEKFWESYHNHKGVDKRMLVWNTIQMERTELKSIIEKE